MEDRLFNWCRACFIRCISIIEKHLIIYEQINGNIARIQLILFIIHLYLYHKCIQIYYWIIK